MPIDFLLITRLAMWKKKKTMLTVDIYNNMVAMSLIEMPVSDDYIARFKEGTSKFRETQ